MTKQAPDSRRGAEVQGKSAGQILSGMSSHCPSANTGKEPRKNRIRNDVKHISLIRQSI